MIISFHQYQNCYDSKAVKKLLTFEETLPRTKKRTLVRPRETLLYCGKMLEKFSENLREVGTSSSIISENKILQLLKTQSRRMLKLCIA